MTKDKGEQDKEEKVEVEHEAEEEKPVEHVEHEEKAVGNSKENPFKKLVALIKRHPRRSMVAIPALLILLLLAIPITRYPILGMAIKRPVSLKITDAKTGEAVSEATVKLGNLESKTDKDGVAKFAKVRLGNTSVTVSKKYYESHTFKLFVGLKAPPTNNQKLTAQGRPVKIRVSNKVSGKAVENASVKIDGEDYKTDASGETQVILAPNSNEAKATVTADGFNSYEAKIVAIEKSEVDEQNSFKITPAGKIFFLSKRTGHIDVMKSNLDGSEAEVVLAGTGKEQETETILLASRDWKYLALKSQREAGKPKLYLIDTSNNKLTTMDEGDAEFTPVGWHNEYFVFQVNRKKNIWEDKRSALKSYNAKSAQLKILDETQGGGTNGSYYVYETFGSVYILEDALVYTKTWDASYTVPLTDKSITITSVKSDSSNKKTLRGFPYSADKYAYIASRLYAPQEIYFQLNSSGNSSYFEYEDGQVKDTKDANQESFNKFYSTYLLSPSGKETFWYEPRDGKNTLFVGNSDGKDGKEVVSLSELTPYGWYTDDYLLVSKKGSELYIMSKEKGATPLKITDYHKPQFNADGYGYGYGGF